MDEKEKSASRRTYLIATSTAAGMASLAGCFGDDATGTLATQVTDQPGDIADFASCIVTIVGMWLGPEEAEAGDEDNEEPANREYYEYDEAQQADLVELQDETTQLIDERELNVATYDFLQLDIDEIDATLEDGSDATVEVPGEAPLTFNQSFEIREDTRTVFTGDFTPVKRREADGYVLQPVADGITVEYEDEE
ncbi:DUF4382 domain-containing protein [Salinarchaeum sp. IM2453]|uniref:DUF4382 domain-containing protein n=1 Tax=Salinarchaeum sp. IM2453 TaxID=2862870 RepID=UPI001C835B8B|nr:DUF4382 domain-containing protein [Salinarchaeum sp. IM2453]QZA88198.1 DUF4382 domain-containing protein [Salinarchaeum sp. IM2453]